MKKGDKVVVHTDGVFAITPAEGNVFDLMLEDIGTVCFKMEESPEKLTMLVSKSGPEVIKGSFEEIEEKRASRDNETDEELVDRIMVENPEDFLDSYVVSVEKTNVKGFMVQNQPMQVERSSKKTKGPDFGL